MKKYTQEEFDVFEKDKHGRKICPSGDYSNIKEFLTQCTFDDGCVFGDGCTFGIGISFNHRHSFGNNCVFGIYCRFGNNSDFGNGCEFDSECYVSCNCVFGNGCEFGNGCKFGSTCVFGDGCNFNVWCDFGNECHFGYKCTFDICCVFGNECDFDKECKVEKDIVLLDFLKFEGFGSESRCTYFFKHPEGIYIRCGCFHGTIEEFRNKVQKTHMNNKYAQGYLKIADLAEWQFNDN